MIFAYQKNNPAFAPIVNFGQNWNDIITNTFTIDGTWTAGNFKSPLIGPSADWGSFHWDFNALESPSQDEQSVDIYGINSNIETLLMTVPAAVTDMALSTVSYTHLTLPTNREV